MKRYKLGIMGAAKFAFGTSLLGFFLSLFFLAMGCENSKVAGVTVSYGRYELSARSLALPSAGSETSSRLFAERKVCLTGGRPSRPTATPAACAPEGSGIRCAAGMGSPTCPRAGPDASPPPALAEIR